MDAFQFGVDLPKAFLSQINQAVFQPQNCVVLDSRRCESAGPLGFDFLRCLLYSFLLTRSHFPEKGLDGVSMRMASINATLEVIWADSV